MRIGIVDADLIGRTKHRFPNLVCQKLSAYWKEQGAEVSLITDPSYSWVNTTEYDRVYISKVFTDTPIPQVFSDLALLNGYWVFNQTEVFIGGTGFYFDKAPNLPDVIEHHMPDYHLYDAWIEQEVQKGAQDAKAKGKSFNKSSFMVQFKEYTDYSIGFLTRGCFRKCQFCVNQKYSHVFTHSPLQEFFDPTRKKICLLDDNFFGCPQWKPMLEQLIATKLPFKFKQEMDERILTDEKCRMLFQANYDGDYTFAFDSIKDYDLIHTKLELIRKYAKPTEKIKFYVLVGFESTGVDDIENAFKRMMLLARYGCMPYIMRYQSKDDAPWKDSPYQGIYIQLARWANQPNLFKKKSFREYCHLEQGLITTEGFVSAPLRALNSFEQQHPDIAAKYFDMHWDDICEVNKNE